jgi:hypothetical protein
MENEIKRSTQAMDVLGLGERIKVFEIGEIKKSKAKRKKFGK